MNRERPDDTAVVQPVAFEDHARLVARRLRSAISEAFASLDADPTKPQTLARRFGIDKSLSWRLSRLMTENDPLVAIPQLPGNSGLGIVVRTLKSAGAQGVLVDAVRTAINEFDRMVELHAGDRETLKMMVGNASPDQRQQREEAHRKLSFLGNSATWGVQARVQICANFIAPGTDPAMVDLAWLSGLIDFRRLRREASWAMAAARKTQDDGSPIALGEIRAIDPDYDHPHAPPLLGEFCSNPLPDIRTEAGPDGVMRYELVEGPVGNTAATTCIIGLFGRNFVRRLRADNDTVGEHFARLYTPVEMLTHDLFVHRELTYALSPKILLYSQMPGGPLFPAAGRERGLLAVSEPIIDLGAPPDTVTPEFPAYPRMVRAVFERLGWDADEFHAFRFRLRYPPIPTLALWRYDLPEANG